MHKLCSLILILMLLAAPPVPGQMDRSARPGEFPAVQLLPPGSEIKGISLPRYQAHRVVAHIMAKMLKVLSRYEVELTDIRTEMYDEGNETTTVLMAKALYDFRTAVMTSDSPGSVENPRFSARGEAAVFSSDARIGLLKGPVHTTLNASVISNPPAKPKK